MSRTPPSSGKYAFLPAADGLLSYLLLLSESVRLHRLGEAEFMPVRVGDVEVPLTPKCVSRFVRRQPCSFESVVVGSDIIDSKNHAAPPSRDRSRVHLQIDERVAVPEAAEFGIRPTVDKVESENLIELHRAGHLPDGERDGTYVLNTHRICPNVGYRHLRPRHGTHGVSRRYWEYSSPNVDSSRCSSPGMTIAKSPTSNPTRTRARADRPAKPAPRSTRVQPRYCGCLQSR